MPVILYNDLGRSLPELPLGSYLLLGTYLTVVAGSRVQGLHQG